MQALGASVLPLPIIDIQEVEDKAPLDMALGALDQYDWILFTSTYAVQFVVRRLTERGIHLEELPQLKVCAIGPGTAAILAGCGIATAIMPNKYVAEGIFQALKDYHGGLSGLAGLRILLPRALEARDVLPRELGAAGALVDIVPCYRNTPGQIEATALHALRTRHLDLLVFTSSSAVHHFVTLIGEADALEMLQRTPIAALGPITARTVASLGVKAAVIPDHHSVPALLAEIGIWGEKNLRSQH